MKPPVPLSSSIDADLALKGYTKDPEWMFKTGLGGTVVAASVLIGLLDIKSFLYVPVAIALYGLITGFILRTTRNRLKDPEAKLSDWGDWGDLFMSGITWLALQFGIFVLVAMIVTSGVSLTYFAVVSGKASAEIVCELCFFFVAAMLFWFSFFSSYLMVNFAHEERLASGFAIRKVFSAFRTHPREMLTGWALANAIQFTSVVGPLCTIIGIFLLPSTFFAGQIVSTTLLAQTWRGVFTEEFKYY